VNTSGIISTVAGNGTAGFSGRWRRCHRRPALFSLRCRGRWCG
jgi:hypothetical protein